MSFYHMLFGVQNVAPVALAMLNIEHSAVPRFRDAWFDWADDAKTDPVIVIHTRTGGGNRDDYEDENRKLTELAGYRFDRDDDFDCTYADFFYDVPEAAREAVVTYLNRCGPPASMQERFEKAMEAIKAAPVPAAKGGGS